MYLSVRDAITNRACFDKNTAFCRERQAIVDKHTQNESFESEPDSCEVDTLETSQCLAKRSRLSYFKFILSTAALSQSVFNIIKYCNVVTTRFWFEVIASGPLPRQQIWVTQTKSKKEMFRGRVKRLNLLRYVKFTCSTSPWALFSDPMFAKVPWSST